jgi:hypothetical protein
LIGASFLTGAFFSSTLGAAFLTTIFFSQLTFLASIFLILQPAAGALIFTHDN